MGDEDGDGDGDVLCENQFYIFTELLHRLILSAFFTFDPFTDRTEISGFLDFLQIPKFK